MGGGGGTHYISMSKGSYFQSGVSSLKTGKSFKYLSGKWFMPGKGLVFFK